MRVRSGGVLTPQKRALYPSRGILWLSYNASLNRLTGSISYVQDCLYTLRRVLKLDLLQVCHQAHPAEDKGQTAPAAAASPAEELARAAKAAGQQQVFSEWAQLNQEEQAQLISMCKVGTETSAPAERGL